MRSLKPSGQLTLVGFCVRHPLAANWNFRATEISRAMAAGQNWPKFQLSLYPLPSGEGILLVKSQFRFLTTRPNQLMGVIDYHVMKAG
jgi:hypothetical protein